MSPWPPPQPWPLPHLNAWAQDPIFDPCVSVGYRIWIWQQQPSVGLRCLAVEGLPLVEAAR